MDINAKNRMANIIDELYSCDPELPGKIHENRKTLGLQIARITKRNNG